MNVVVFGAGAIGSLLGAILASRHDVSLIGRKAHVDAIRSAGLEVVGNLRRRVNLPAFDAPHPSLRADLVVLTVKAFDTAQALREMKPIMGASTVLLVAQNGLGNWELARQAFPTHRVLAASVTVGASLQAPGRVSWNGPGEVVVGGEPADRPSAEEVARMFSGAGIEARAAPDIRPALWRKALVNAAINPLSALHRVENGRLLEDPVLRERLLAAAEEAARVMRAEGLAISDEEARTLAETVASRTAGNRSSMLQSIELGKRTEIDAITGKILEAARRHRLACPVNQGLYDAVTALAPARA